MSKLDKIISIVAWILILHQLISYTSFTINKDWKSSSRAWFNKINILEKASSDTSDIGTLGEEKKKDNKDLRHIELINSIKNSRLENIIKNPATSLTMEKLSKVPLYGSSVYYRKGNGHEVHGLQYIGIKCEKLINGSKENFRKHQKFLLKFKKTQLTPPFYKKITKSCDSFIQSRGYITNVTIEEKNFPIAYGIVMHKDIEMAERLLRAIYRRSNYYCIHIDAKSPHKLREAMVAIVKCFENVFITSKSVTVNWGRYSVFEADLTCMDNLLKKDGWKYFINLAGQEFPLKTNLEIVKILTAFDGASSISGVPFSKHTWKLRMANVKKITDLVYRKGSQHIVASRKFVTYIRTAPIALKFADWLKNATHPHETFYNTLYFSKSLKIPGCYNGSKLKLPEAKSMARFKLWKFNQKRCSGKWVRGICIFGLEELPKLVKAPQLFSNKYHSDYKPVVLDCVEQWLFNKIEKEKMSKNRIIDISYYENLDFVRNKF